MQKYFLLLLYFVLFGAQSFGIELSLAPGLSVKNLLLYAILAMLAIIAAREHAAKDHFAQKASRPVHTDAASLKSIHLAYMLFAFYALISMLVVISMFASKNYDVITSVVSYKSNLLDRYLFFLVFFFGIASYKDAVWLLKAMLFIFILGNTITLVDALDIPDLGIIHQRRDGRVSGPMGESNQYGAFLVLFLPLCAYAAIMTRGIQRIFFSIGFIMSLGVLLLAASRGAMVGLVAAIAIVTVLEWKYISKKYFLPGAIAIFVVGTIVVVIVASQTDGLLTERFIDQSGGYGSSARSISSGRNEIWGSAFNKMNEFPLSYLHGYGWFSWGASDGLQRLYENVTKYNMAPHNSYLAYFFELGALGLGLFLSVLCLIIAYVRRALQYATTQARGIIIAFLYGFFALLIAIVFVDLFNPWVYVWSLVGLIVRVAYEMIVNPESTLSMEDQLAADQQEQGDQPASPPVNSVGARPF